MKFYLKIFLVIVCVANQIRLTFLWGIPDSQGVNHFERDEFNVPVDGNGGSEEALSTEDKNQDPALTKQDRKATTLERLPLISLIEKRDYTLPRANTYQSSNVSVDFIPGKENNTWKVEKVQGTGFSKEVLETQHATCQVTTEELVATAQATVTRVLKGLCNAKEMDNNFHTLEALLSNQLTTIKEALKRIESRLGDQSDMISRGQKEMNFALQKNCGNSDVSEIDRRSSKLQDISGSKSRHPDLNEDASLEEEWKGVRDPEILKYNSSIHMEASLNGPAKKVFTYYWKIDQMHHKMTVWNPRRSLRSQSFYIFPSGYRMYLRIFPRHDEENFYVHVGLTKGEFDEKLKWPFPHKHKVYILDQTREGRTFEDIASRIWDPNQLCSEFNWQKPTKGDNYECVGLGFPHDVLRQREYISQDAVIIKLTVYLDG